MSPRVRRDVGKSRSPRQGYLGQVNVGEAEGPLAWTGGRGSSWLKGTGLGPVVL